MNRTWWAAGPAAIFLAQTGVANATEPKVCTLPGCVTDALAHGPDLKGKDAAIDAALAGKDQARGNYGPKLMVSGGVQIWNDEIAADFNLGIPGVVIPPLIVRQQVTWNVNVTLAQPLTGLWSIYEANQLAALGVDVAQLERDAAKNQKALQVTEAWLTAVLADDLVAVRKTSLEARSSDREKAGALVRAGVIVEADLLRADLGITQAKQALALAERQASLARARLTQLVGAPVVPSGAANATGVTETVSLDAAKKAALEDRIELRQVRQRVQQAQTVVDLAYSKMAPTVNFVAQAQFARASAFGDNVAGFVGVTFDWTVWEWGATAFGIDQARAHVREAQAGLEQLEEGIALEVEAAWVEQASAIDQGVLAKEAVRVSEENYSLVRKRFENKAATSYDLVQAETDLTKARSDEKMALVSGYLARARLARAMGKSADEIAKEGTP